MTDKVEDLLREVHEETDPKLERFRYIAGLYESGKISTTTFSNMMQEEYENSKKKNPEV
jgi:hypothetical protein